MIEESILSPEGRLFQVEYAIEAIKLGSTAIGLKTKEGVVLVVEKRITSPLLEPGSMEKVMEIDEHIGCAMSGLIADARTMVEHARVETQNHRFSYGEPMTIESTTQTLVIWHYDLVKALKNPCLVHLLYHFSLLVMMRMVPACIILIHLGHFGNAMQKLLVQVQKVPIALCRSNATRISLFKKLRLSHFPF